MVGRVLLLCVKQLIIQVLGHISPTDTVLKFCLNVSVAQLEYHCASKAKFMRSIPENTHSNERHVFIVICSLPKQILSPLNPKVFISPTMDENCLVTDIFPNIFPCVQQKKDIFTGLEQRNASFFNAKYYLGQIAVWD